MSSSSQRHYSLHSHRLSKPSTSISIAMATTSLLLPLLFLLLLSTTTASTSPESYISTVISQAGLDFAKDLLVGHAIRSLAPLRVPDMERTVRVPLVGQVHMTAANIVLTGIAVSDSTARAGDSGIVIAASGARVNLSMEWSYSYSAWFITISDQGNASIQVEGMEVGVSMGMKNQDGSLKLIVRECGCSMKDVDITLDGGASWFYQGFVDSFGNHIRSSVENTIANKITEGTSRLDSLLEGLPKKIDVDKIAAVNVTFVNDPLFRGSSVEFDINGLFVSSDKVADPRYLCHEYTYIAPHTNIAPSLGGTSKMLWISLDESVFNSAAAVYFQAGLMHWIVDKVPDQSLLNTATWRFLIPQLNRKYPNDDMLLNISVTSPPFMKITVGKIAANVDLDIIVDVVDFDEKVPVACIQTAVTVSGAVEVSGNNLAGTVELDDFSLILKWSKVGNLHTVLIQGVMRIFLKTVFVPYVNSYLMRGFPLPIIKGFAIRDAYILTSYSRIVVSSNVVFNDSSDIMHAMNHSYHNAGYVMYGNVRMQP